MADPTIFFQLNTDRLPRAPVPGLQVPTIPIEFHAPIGTVVLCWGHLEPVVREWMRTLVHAIPSSDDKDWEGVRSFERIRKMALKKTRRAFSKHPLIVSYYDNVFALLKVLAQRRNVLTHGEYSLTNEDGTLVLRASAVVENARQTIIVTTTLVEELYHDIGVALALLTFPLMSDEQAAALPSHERSIIRDFVASHHPNGSIQTIPEYLRPPSLR